MRGRAETQTGDTGGSLGWKMGQGPCKKAGGVEGEGEARGFTRCECCT